jgi:hypothetical protein
MRIGTKVEPEELSSKIRPIIIRRNTCADEWDVRHRFVVEHLCRGDWAGTLEFCYFKHEENFAVDFLSGAYDAYLYYFSDEADRVEFQLRFC